ncbi:MAG TPA: helix-turn-helix domain-containing protein [Ferruginibacter sp.]|nr:helix-turn-helix domain-containing protein [Ferruginibacter sp.]
MDHHFMQALSQNTHVSRVINSVETGELIASRTILHPDAFNGYLHYHDNAHFSFVLRGGCAEKKKEHYERQPGSITWYPAGELHQITAVTAPSYHVNFELLPGFFTTNNIDPVTIGAAIAGHPGIRPLMLQVYRELDHTDSDSIFSLQQILLNLVQQTVSLRKSGLPRWAIIVREHLHDNWNKNVSLEKLSLVAGVHAVTISKYFPVYFSCTLGQYRRKLKIDQAIGKINRFPFLNMAQLAFDCGFADESHLIRTFREVTNILPGHFRKWVRGR